MKIGLGSVQFGLNYGINNSIGKPDIQTVTEIIRIAAKHNISLIDTASDYGNSEEVIGQIETSRSFKIVTKLSRNKKVSDSIDESLKKLRIRRLEGALFHDFLQFKSNISLWGELEELKDMGVINKIGFSLYHPIDLEYILERNIKIDLVQIPFSVFDRRFDPYFNLLKTNSVEIHCRSIFLQGLIFKPSELLDNYFNPIKPKIEEAARLSAESGKSLQSLFLNFVYKNPSIDKIIIGVDSVNNLNENILALKEGIGDKELGILEGLIESNEDMLLPYKWKS